MDGRGEHLTAPRTVADLSAVPSRERVTDRDEAMDGAVAILSAHVPDPDDGTCAGCLAQWDRWIPHADCPQVAWARRVVETHAAWDDEQPTARDATDVHPAWAPAPR